MTSLDQQLDNAFTQLVDAFDCLLPHAGFSFGHTVIQDRNFHSRDIDAAIADIDQFYQNVVEREGESAAKVWRNAAYHLLMCMKTIADVWPDDREIDYTA